MDLITPLPVDIFTLLNLNLTLIVENGLKGEMYMNILLIHMKILKDKIVKEKRNILSFDLKNLQLAAYVNNFNQCKTHLKEIGQRYLQNTCEVYSERINN